MKRKIKMKQILMCILIATVVAILGEASWNLPVFLGREEKYLNINLENVEKENFDLDDGKLIQKAENAKIRIEFPEQYIDKFSFIYSGNFAEALKCKLIVYTKDTEGKTVGRSIEENNNVIATRSVTNIRMKAEAIEVIVEENQELNISQIAIDNTGNFSIVRFLLIATVAFWITWMFVYKGNIINRTEVVFAGMAFMIGTIAILAAPNHKVGWDEEIHFRNAYGLSYLMEMKTEMFYPPTVEMLSSVSSQNWPYYLSSSEDEKEDEMKYWNMNADSELEKDSRYYTEHIEVKLNLLGYVSQAIFIEIAKIFNLSFSTLYLAGKFGNLFMYIILCFIAIRHIPIGKNLLMAIAMMPTPLFLATVYSYDATVNGFIFLGVSYWLGEILSEKEKISRKNYLVFILAIAVASCVKAVYIPLMLLGLLIPNSKFNSKREANLLKGMMFLIVLLLAVTFLIPTGERTDIRGGDTGVGRQVRAIFTHPIIYTKLLLSSIWDNLVRFSIGSDGMSLMGHLGEGKYTQWIVAFLAGVALTDKRENEPRLKWTSKVTIIGIIFTITCLIWTALYVSFTPVGADVISGVQGRYFIPLLVPGLILFNFSKIENHVNEKTYSKIIQISAFTLTVLSYYSVIIKSCF